MPQTVSVSEIFVVLKPFLTPMFLLMSLPLVLFAFGRILEVFKHAIGDIYDSTSYDSKSEPKEDIYFDDRKDGYWVKMSDGSRSFVGMNDLYPNDIDRIDLTKKG